MTGNSIKKAVPALLAVAALSARGASLDADALRAAALGADWGGPTGGVRRVLGTDGKFESGAVYVADRRLYEFSHDKAPVRSCPATFVKGHHFPRPVAFHLKGLRNVTLDFAGATVLLRGKVQPFLLEDCENVTVKNVSVRYDRSPFTQGTVRSCTDRELTLEVGAAFPIRVDGTDLFFTSEHWTDGPVNTRPCFMQFFEKGTRKGAGLALAFFAGKLDIDKSVPWANSSIRFTPRMEGGNLVLTSDRSLKPWAGGMRSGNAAVIGHAKRDFSNCEMAECRNVRIENYRILNGVGMGIFPFHCRNVLLDGVRMTCDAESPTVVANAADGIHAFACSGDFVVRGCTVEGTIDDALNVHGNYYTVESAKGDEIVAYTRLEPEGTTAIYRPGDRIAVCRGFTLDRTAEYVIRATRPVDEKHVAFTLDRAVGDHAANDLIENLSAQCRLLIVNSRFGKANTHLRLQTRGGVLIDGCETELPFWLTGDSTYWFESSPCDSVVVRNTRFVGGRGVVRSCPEYRPSPAHPHYHGDLLLANCTFDVEAAVQAHGLRSVTVNGCRTSSGRPVKVDRGNCPSVAFDVPELLLSSCPEPGPEGVRLPLVGRLRPRTAPDPRDDQWMIGCEVLDRDFAKFSAYRDYLPLLGIRSIRLQGGWAKCEREKGKYDFGWLDEPVDFALAHGLNPVLETDYGNPLYKGGGGRDLAAGFPYGEEGLAAWDRWVDALSRHFKGRVRDWAMWNEPDIGNPADTAAVGGRHTPEKIAAFNARTAKIIRRNIPDARIAGLSLATNDPKFNEDCHKAFGPDIGLFWRFIYHGYAPAPESSYDNVEALKRLCAQYAPHATLWQGENGAPSEMPGDGLALNHIAWSETSQAKWDMRRMLGDYVREIPSSVFTICDYFHPGRGIGSYGLLRADAAKDVIAVKRAYHAVRNVATVFDSSVERVTRKVSSPERPLQLWEFRRRGKPLFVFWTTGAWRRDGREWKMDYVRPHDDCRTRPAIVEWEGRAFANPVWVDLLTGGIYEFPAAKMLPRAGGVTFVDVPVYDSPCLLTERDALDESPVESASYPGCGRN